MHSRRYSHFFSTLYDETGPVGHLGRGTHYSVLRCAEWLDVTRRPVARAEIHDFAVIWDEDHDERVIPVIEQIYLEGLLSPVQFIGERKGTLTIIVAARFFFDSQEALDDYIQRIRTIVESQKGDVWDSDIGLFDRQTGSPHQTDLRALIMAPEEPVVTYVRNIDNLWKLGTRSYTDR